MKHIVKTLLSLSLVFILLFSLLCGCAKAPQDSTAPSQNKKQTIAFQDQELVWSVESGILDGERHLLFSVTNNSKFLLKSMTISFKEKAEFPQEEKEALYTELIDLLDLDKEEAKEMKEKPFSAHADLDHILEAGASSSNNRCYYFDGSSCIDNPEHLTQLVPDFATIAYLDGDEIYTGYYDFSTKKFSVSDETAPAYSWGSGPLSDIIPKLDGKLTEVSLEWEGTLSIDVFGVSKADFDAYVKLCREQGYTEDVSQYSSSFSAKHTDGIHELDVNYFSESDQLYISLEEKKE